MSPDAGSISWVRQVLMGQDPTLMDPAILKQKPIQTDQFGSIFSSLARFFPVLARFVFDFFRFGFNSVRFFWLFQ